MGGLLTSALDALTYLKTNQYKLPTAKGSQVCGYILANLILTGIGALAAYALAAGAQLDGVLAAVASGIAAPEILKKAASGLVGP